MNKLDLLHKIKDLQGLTNDEKAILINLVNTNKKYGLVWEDKPEDVEEELLTKLPVLIEDKTKFIGAKPQEKKVDLFTEDATAPSPLERAGGEAPNHILIEGDNLHALTALTFTHEGEIDAMYFDPPYNTGNKDFKYNDSFVDREDSYRHSKWLSFMNKRLHLAKRLLKDKGVVFISIDDNEVSQLKILCDEIYGEDNFIGIVCWFKKRKGSFLSDNLVSLTEYILIYKKGKGVKLFGGEVDNTGSGPIVKRTNSIKTLKFPASFVKTKLKDGSYLKGSYGKGTTGTILKNDIEIKDGIILNEFEIEAPFVWTQTFLDEEINNGTEVIINTANLQPRVIRVNNESFKAMPSFIDGRDIGGTNEDAYEFLKDMFKTDRLFSYSKPLNLIKKLLHSATFDKKNALILDIFAGSGTTLHATMQLNAEDGGNRQCILVTNNENNIAEEVCYERNKRVINGYKKANGDNVEGLSNNNLRYFKTSFVGREKSSKNKRELTQLATELLCIKEDCYNETKAPKNIRLFEENKKRFMVIYDDNVIPKAIEVINSLTFDESWGEVKVYVFSEGQDPYTEDFMEVANKVSLCALPDAIYKAYLHVLPKKSRKGIPHIEEIIPVAENGSAQLTMDINN